MNLWVVWWRADCSIADGKQVERSALSLYLTHKIRFYVTHSTRWIEKKRQKLSQCQTLRPNNSNSKAAHTNLNCNDSTTPTIVFLVIVLVWSPTNNCSASTCLYRMIKLLFVKHVRQTCVFLSTRLLLLLLCDDRLITNIHNIFSLVSAK